MLVGVSRLMPGTAVPDGLEAVCVAACSSAPMGAQRAAAAARAAPRPSVLSQLRSRVVATAPQAPAVALAVEQPLGQSPRLPSWATASLFLEELAAVLLLPGRAS